VEFYRSEASPTKRVPRKFERSMKLPFFFILLMQLTMPCVAKRSAWECLQVMAESHLDLILGVLDLLYLQHYIANQFSAVVLWS